MSTTISYCEDITKNPANDNIPYQAPLFNLDDYDGELTQFDLTPDQRAQLLRTLWDMMVNCVDLAWDAPPSHNSCGKLIQNTFENAADSRHAVESENPQTQASQGGR